MKKIPAVSFSELFGILFDPRVPLSFLFGTLALAVAGNATYDLVLSMAYNESPVPRFSLIAIIVVALLIMIAAVVVLMIVLRARWPASSLDGSEAFKVARKAIIFTVGKQKDTILIALEKQHPSHVGFICTEETLPVVEEIIQQFGARSEVQVVNPWDIKGIYNAGVKIVSALRGGNPFEPKDLVMDVTGGLTPLSIGAFRAAEDQGVDTQYIRSQYDKQGKRIPNTEQAILLTRHRRQALTG